jgi:hypothetical protein
VTNQLIDDGRVGIFHLAVDTIHDGEATALLSLMSNFLIIRAEMHFVPRLIEYKAYSHLFGVVDEGDAIPVYNIIVDKGVVIAQRQI